nr:hypothetical protein 9 [bacterium]
MSSDSNALALANIKGLETIEGIVREVSASSSEDMEQAVEGSLKVAVAIGQLFGFLEQPEVKELVNYLAGSPLGFKSDKTYPWDVVRNVCIDALVNGYRLTGNEFNIIAGNFYPAQAGKFRKIVEHPGLTDFTYRLDPPSGGKVKCAATWKLRGVAQSIGLEKWDECVIPVKLNSASTDDNTLGKAKSKLFSRVLERLTGVVQGEATDLEYEANGAVVQSGSKKYQTKQLLGELGAKEAEPAPQQQAEDQPAQEEEPDLAVQKLLENLEPLIQNTPNATSKGWPQALAQAKKAQDPELELTRLMVIVLADRLDEGGPEYQDAAAAANDLNTLNDLWRDVFDRLEAQKQATASAQ